MYFYLKYILSISYRMLQTLFVSENNSGIVNVQSARDCDLLTFACLDCFGQKPHFYKWNSQQQPIPFKGSHELAYMAVL